MRRLSNWASMPRHSSSGLSQRWSGHKLVCTSTLPRPSSKPECKEGLKSSANFGYIPGAETVSQDLEAFAKYISSLCENVIPSIVKADCKSLITLDMLVARQSMPRM
jgi:hypothetical protein